MKRTGFTLIELTAVVLIMALLASATVLSLAHTAGQHRFDSLRDELARADGLVRSAARQGGNHEQLIYDLDDGTVSWRQDGQSDPVRLIRLGEHDTLEVRTADQDLSAGQVTIDCSPSGHSPSYALKLTRLPEDPHWMIVAGLSGRIIWTENETQVEAIFQSLSTQGLHATGVEAP